MELGQVCIKTRGRDAGKKVVIISDIKEGRVLVDGPKVRRKQCNILHLFPTEKKIKIGKDAKHEDIIKNLEK